MPSTNIVIGVVNRVATPPSDAVIVCGNSGYALTFDFDSEWFAETTKIARFVWFSKNKTYSEEIPFDGNTVEVPILSNTNAVYAGVYAGNLRTTTPAKIVCEPSILCYGQDANMNPSDLALIKGQIAKLVDALRDISVDPTEIKNAVIEYLTKNPPKVTETDPTVPEWAKQPQKPKYTAKEVGAVASSELSNAVNDALAQAKASGEFDGRDGYTPVKGKDYFDGYTPVKGKDYFDGDDYVLTPDDIAEIAEMAAKLVEVPEQDSGGNAGFVVQPTAPEDTSALWVDTSDNTHDADFQEAVNAALAQAKESGEFDGEPGYTPQKGVDYFDGKDGKDGEDYVLTEDDKTEIAEQAAALVEVPESGGIAVTGATVGQTVKIAAVDENGVPTAWLPTDFPSGGEDVKEWEEFLRFTVDNAETTVFDFSSNGKETLESKKVKEFYLYSPIIMSTGCGTASVLVNNRVNINNLVDFGRSNAGSLKLNLFSDDNALEVRYFGRDSENNLNFRVTQAMSYGGTESDGIITASMNEKNSLCRVGDWINGIPFHSNPIDYIKTVVVTTAETCAAGVEFIVYVR